MLNGQPAASAASGKWNCGLCAQFDTTSPRKVSTISTAEVTRLGSEVRGGALRASTPTAPVIRPRDGECGAVLCAQVTGF